MNIVNKNNNYNIKKKKKKIFYIKKINKIKN